MSFIDKTKQQFKVFMDSEPKGVFKLIILCVLVLAAFMFLFTGLSRIFSFAYHAYGINVSEMVYAYYGGMKAVDIIYGIISLALAALSCFAALSLFNCKPNASKLIALVFGGACCIDLLHFILSIIILSADGVSIGYYIFRILILAALFILCRMIFEKKDIAGVFKK